MKEVLSVNQRCPLFEVSVNWRFDCAKSQRFGAVGSRSQEAPLITSVQYCGGCSALWGDSISTCGGITSVLWKNSISTVGDSISTVEAFQYCGGIASVHVGG